LPLRHAPAGSPHERRRGGAAAGPSAGAHGQRTGMLATGKLASSGTLMSEWRQCQVWFFGHPWI
jgi:hypothetical protein